MIEAIGGDTQVALGFGFMVAMTVGGAILGQVIARTRHGSALEQLRKDLEDHEKWRQKSTQQLRELLDDMIRREARAEAEAAASSTHRPRPPR
jgi:uncharacterized protein YlxW (UPF0749 family)